MTIQHSIPSSERRPGIYPEFNVRSAARGLAPLTTRIALVGTRLSTGSKAALELAQVFSDAEADSYHGEGSELALMARWAHKGARDYGAGPEIWTIGIDEPAGGTAAVEHLTVTGPATAAGNIVLKIAGRIVLVPVADGDAQNDIATDLAAAINALGAELPVTAAVDAVTLNQVNATCRYKGANGNDIVYEVVSTPDGVTVTAAVGTAGAGVYDLTTALDALADKDYDFVVVANHETADITDLVAHMDEMWNPATKRFRWFALAEPGNLSTATALADAANDYRGMVFWAEGSPNLPGEIAAYWCAQFAAEEDPALPWNNFEGRSLYLADKTDAPVGSEVNTAIGDGLTVVTLNENQTHMKLVRAVTTKTSEDSQQFYATLDLGISRSMVYLAVQVEIAIARAFPRAKKLERTKTRVRSVVLDTMERVEDLEIIQLVEELADQLVVEDDAIDPTTLVAAIPTAVVPPLNKFIPVMNLIVR